MDSAEIEKIIKEIRQRAIFVQIILEEINLEEFNPVDSPETVKPKAGKMCQNYLSRL